MMYLGFGILTGLLIVPLAGAALILVLRGDEASVNSNARYMALFTTIFTFVLACVAWYGFDPANPAFQMVETHAWVSDAIKFKLGVDGFSFPFVVLTAFLMPFCILASWTSVEKRVREYMVAFLVLETLMIGVFVALDLVLFYLFFEAGLIPMFLIIGIWGGKRRVYASYKFFLYTLLGSVLMLLALMAMYWNAGTTDIPTLLTHHFPSGMQPWLWLAFFASFAVKMPMWPVHTWLPDAHVEAPTAGSVILAAILLKMGGYGFIRFSIPMFPEASQLFAPLVFALSVIAIVYTSLVALMQEDIKKLIAYSSVAHMGFVTMGLFTLTPQGIQGAMFQMMSHGLVSGALFLCVGVIYDRMHTREIAAYGGLVNRMPLYAVAFMVFTMANVGLPGTAGFVGEFLTLVGAFKANPWVAFFATSGVILSAAYALWLYRRVIFGELVKPELKTITDLNRREMLILAPLVLLTIWYGVAPGTILDAFAAPTEHLIKNYQAALTAAKTAMLAVQ
jgi:NADH-quinone oxidoreductase subunit M